MTEHVILGADHAGFQLKALCYEHLRDQGRHCEDLGTDTGEISCDYPVFAQKVCERVKAVQGFGLLICGSGVGMSMAANRYAGIRASLCTDEFSARVSRGHNNANVLCLGARVVGPGLALSVLDEFLRIEFEGGRHLRRIRLFD